MIKQWKFFLVLSKKQKEMQDLKFHFELEKSRKMKGREISS